MRLCRSVTLHPTGLFCRTRNCAMERFARVMVARWPVTMASSSAAASSVFGSWVAAPTPMLITTLETRGASITLL